MPESDPVSRNASREPSRSAVCTHAPVRLPYGCGDAPEARPISLRTSAFTIATVPVSVTARGPCTSHGAATPSTANPICRNSLPRTENSARKSSPVATPGIAWMARNGSSASTPRSSCSSAERIRNSTGAVARGGSSPARTVTCSV